MHFDSNNKWIWSVIYWWGDNNVALIFALIFIRRAFITVSTKSKNYWILCFTHFHHYFSLTQTQTHAMKLYSWKLNIFFGFVLQCKFWFLLTLSGPILCWCDCWISYFLHQNYSFSLFEFIFLNLVIISCRLISLH